MTMCLFGTKPLILSLKTEALSHFKLFHILVCAVNLFSLNHLILLFDSEQILGLDNYTRMSWGFFVLF